MSERFKLSADELLALQQKAELVPRPSFQALEDTEAITASDMACFSEIRAVLYKHGKIDKFGVVLLHDHFGLAENETLLEVSDADDKSMTTKAAVIDPSDISYRDTQWYLGNSMPLSLVKCRTSWHK